MDSHAKEDRAICEEGQAQPRGGPSSRSRHSHEEDQAQGACRWLPLRGSRDKSQRNRHQLKEKEQCIGNQQAGPEEEEQCRRSQHSSGGTGVPNKQDSSRRTGVVLEGPPVLYSMKKVLSGEREQEQRRWRCCEEVYNHTSSSSKVEWILIHSTPIITSYHFSISIY